VLAAQVAALGAIPTYMVQMSPQLASRVLTENGSLFEIDPPDMPSGAYILQPLPQRQLATLIRQAVTPTLFGGDLDGFIDHMQAMLAINPSLRPTAATVSRHRWLADAIGAAKDELGEDAPASLVSSSMRSDDREARGEDVAIDEADARIAEALAAMEALATKQGSYVPKSALIASPASSYSDGSSLPGSFKQALSSSSLTGSFKQSYSSPHPAPSMGHGSPKGNACDERWSHLGSRPATSEGGGGSVQNASLERAGSGTSAKPAQTTFVRSPQASALVGALGMLAPSPGSRPNLGPNHSQTKP